ncbi:hypothetical protein GCM10025872_27340 [Barrientosiimonas endolithica]|uniref:ATP-grasp domain-containing protein n=1 Tax=Barrientosiimonas endolithica TaxID=1535208 RepID=A0ABM8HDM5_9MICO|nr:hypothetical protein GCM10025872_27340 [Barrientosiimonas endolithica]
MLLGADASTYSLARSFHEEYAAISVAVSRLGAGPVANSRIIEVSRLADFDDDDALVAHLQGLGERFGDRPLLLLTSTDYLVRRIVTLRDRLEPRLTIPYPGLALIDRLTDKAQFAELCSELGIAHPETVVYDVARHEQLKEDPQLRERLSRLSFPIIAKTGNSATYERYDFPGKQKVHTAGSREELMDLMQRVHDSGYPGTFILQDMIPGLDDGMRILTCYCDRAGKVRMGAFGHVLLEEHLPETLGVPAAIITGQDRAVLDEAVRLLEHVGWRGYANFDLKYDPRDGRTKFFELNPGSAGPTSTSTPAGSTPPATTSSSTSTAATSPTSRASWSRRRRSSTPRCRCRWSCATCRATCARRCSRSSRAARSPTR